MMPETNGRPLGALALAVALTAGCTTTDPGADFARVGALTDERVGGAMAPSTLMDAPIDGATQAWDGRAPLTADTAVAVALQHDPALRTALTRVAGRRADLAQADRLPNPTLAFGIGIALDGLSGAPATASLGEALAWIWSRSYALEAAGAGLEQAILTAADHAVQLEARVRSAHVDLIVAQQRTELTRERAHVLAQRSDLEAQRAEAGEAAPDDADAARAAAALARAKAIEADGAERSARLALLAVMGRAPASADWRAAGALPDDPGPVADDTEAQRWALERPLPVRAAAEGLRRAEADAEAAGLTRWPRPTGTLMWQRNFSGRDALMPGMQIEIPVLDDGSPARAQASARRREAWLAHHASRLTAVAEARAAWNEYESLRAQRDAFRDDVLPATRARADVAAARFRRGATTRLPALAAQSERLERELELLDVERRTARAVIELHRTLGGAPTSPERAGTRPESEVTS